MNLIALLTLLFSVTTFPAGDHSKPATDPLAGALFPPELVLLARDRLAMTPEQLSAIHARVEQARPQTEEWRGKLESATAALAALARQEHVEEAAFNAQLDQVLDAERELKHLHVGVLIATKNLLTPAQQAQLREIAKSGSASLTEDARKRLLGKVELVKGLAKSWAAAGRDPGEILKTMDERFGPLMKAGQVVEAEVELDRILAQLKQPVK